MRSILVRLGLTALVIGGLAGCGGASIGVNGVNGTTGTAGGTNAVATVNGTALTATDWMALAPQISASDISVSIATASGVAGTPVVKFKVTDQNGNPVVGLGGSYPAVGTAVTHSMYNINFTLAKLVPGTNGNPAKWVNLLVDKPVAPSTTGAVVNGGLSWLAAYPTAEAQGTMVDNGDGTYQYTFLRDIKQTQAIVNAVGAGAYEGSANTSKPNGAGTAGVYHIADLDPANLAFDPTATHRLGIFIQGSQPGTGINTPTATASTTPVPLLKTFNIGYDFRPDGNPITATRDIVDAGSCDACHNNVSLKRGIGHISTTGTSNLAVSYSASGVATTVTMSNGIPAGAYVGRNDPKLCVTCHTDQAKYGFPVVTGDGTYAYTGAYYRVSTGVMSDNQAAFIYPRLIHQTHMGNQLTKQGYNLNANCSGPALSQGAAQCLNNVGYPQDQRNCTKCHTGTAVAVAPGMSAPVVTPDGDNWKNVPSQVACGACHDGINFATGQGSTLADKYADMLAGNAPGTTHSGHQGGTVGLPDNSTCTTCHATGQLADIQVYHETNFSTPNNPTAKTGVDTVAYNLKSVTVNSSHQPVITFQIVINGMPVTSLLVQTPVVNGKTGALVVNTYAPLTAYSELLSGPALYAAYAVPQDGIASPSDFNARANVNLANLLIDTTGGTAPTSPAQGYLTNHVSSGAFQADSSGYFTAVLTGDKIGQPVTGTCLQPVATPAQISSGGSSVITGNCVNPSPIVLPTTATMVTGAIIGGFTQTNLTAYPYTAGNLTANPNVAATGSGLHVTAKLQKLVATGYTARRVIVSAANCQNCHEQLGTNQFMENGQLKNTGLRLGFHNGDRNDPTACNICHNGTGADASGFPYDSSTWYHGIHGASQRTVPFVVEGKGAENYSVLLYPGQLKDCSQCHLPNTANFGIAEATGQLPNKLWSYTAAGTVVAPTASTSTVINVITGVNGAAGAYVAPAVPAGSLSAAPAGVYGNGFSYVPASAVASSYLTCGGGAMPCATVAPVQIAPAGGLTIAADPTTLVNSPFASACSSCHDDPVSQGHIAQNGGKIQVSRGTAAALANTEACVTCHGQGRTMDAVVIHQQR
jgi:OmcA/MtrC family decaheme c-type cytochrome